MCLCVRVRPKIVHLNWIFVKAQNCGQIIGNLLHNQMILTPVAINAHGRIGPMFWQHLYGTPPPDIPPRKQFKPNRPDAKAMYDRATTLPAPIGIFIEADQRWKLLQSDSPQSTPQSKILRTQPLCPNNFHNHNPTTRIRYYSCLQHSHHQLLQKACPFSDITSLWSLWLPVASRPNCWFIVR